MGHIDFIHAPTHSLTPRKQDPLDDFLDTKTAQTARAVKTFHGSYLPRLGSQPSTGSHVVNKTYMDRKSGSPHAHAGTGGGGGGGTSFMLGGSVTSPLVDYLSGLGAGSLYRLPNLPVTPYNANSLLVGGKYLFLPLGNISTTVRAINLYSMAALTLPATPSNNDGGADGIHQKRYIYMHAGFVAAGIAGSAFWRYDLWRNKWESLTRITTFNASYRFASAGPIVYDGSRYFYIAPVNYTGVVDSGRLFSFDTQNGSWTKLHGTLGLTVRAMAWAGGSVMMLGAEGSLWEWRTGAGTLFRKSKGGGTQANNMGMLWDPSNPGTLWVLGGSGKTRISRYSIPGNAWTDLTPAAGTPGELQGRGVYFAKPYPHILQYRRSTNQLYLFKIP